MKRNEQKSDKVPLRYNALPPRLKTYLKHRSPDPEGLDDSEIKRFLKEFREQFFEHEEPAIDVKTMRRAMKIAVAERRRIKKLKQERHMAPVSD